MVWMLWIDNEKCNKFFVASDVLLQKHLPQSLFFSKYKKMVQNKISSVEVIEIKSAYTPSIEGESIDSRRGH